MTSNPFVQPGRFFKGNLHTHSTQSDGQLPPQEVCRRYREAGYDFICLSDHFLPAYDFPVSDTRPYRTDSFTTILGAEVHVPSTSLGEKCHLLANGLPLDFAPPREGEGGFGVAVRDFGEGPQGGAQAFFGNKPAGLDKMPGSFGGKRAGHEGPGIKRNARALEAQFLRGAAQLFQAVEEGFGAGENEGAALEDLLERRAPGRALRVHPDIGPVKGNHHRARAGGDEWQQLHPDVAEEDMHHPRVEAQGFVNQPVNPRGGDQARRRFLQARGGRTVRRFFSPGKGNWAAFSRFWVITAGCQRDKDMICRWTCCMSGLRKS